MVEIKQGNYTHNIKEILINQYAEVENYPYGFVLKTKKRYSIEQNKKGCRVIEQTLNPKTNQWNKPKKSTYSPIKKL